MGVNIRGQIPIDFGRPISRQRVIQENGKTLNLCIIKTPASHAPADHPLKTRRFEHLQKRPLLHDFNMKKLESDPNYRKMSPHGGRHKRVFNVKTIGI
jgi:hypothetical protein